MVIRYNEEQNCFWLNNICIRIAVIRFSAPRTPFQFFFSLLFRYAHGSNAARILQMLSQMEVMKDYVKMYHNPVCHSPQKQETLLKNSCKECSFSTELGNAGEEKGPLSPAPTELLSHNEKKNSSWFRPWNFRSLGVGKSLKSFCISIVHQVIKRTLLVQEIQLRDA